MKPYGIILGVLFPIRNLLAAAIVVFYFFVWRVLKFDVVNKKFVYFELYLDSWLGKLARVVKLYDLDTIGPGPRTQYGGGVEFPSNNTAHSVFSSSTKHQTRIQNLYKDPQTRTAGIPTQAAIQSIIHRVWL